MVSIVASLHAAFKENEKYRKKDKMENSHWRLNCRNSHWRRRVEDTNCIKAIINYSGVATQKSAAVFKSKVFTAT